VRSGRLPGWCVPTHGLVENALSKAEPAIVYARLGLSATRHPAYRSSTRQRLRAVSPTWNAVPAGIHCARRSAGSAGTNNAEPAHRAAPTGTTRKRDFGAAVWCPLRKQILTQKNRLPVFARKVAPRATLYETYVGSKKPMRARCVRAGKGEEIKQGHR